MLRPWSSIEIISERRRRFALALVEYVYRIRQGNNLQVVFKQGDLEHALQGDLTLQDLEIKDWDRALSSALLYLDANEVLKLSRGKALFRSAMNITLNAESRRRQFSKGDYAELLVLAGPGSGKTRVIVHRVAWLLRQGMAHPQDIMVLAYNRSAVGKLIREYRNDDLPKIAATVDLLTTGVDVPAITNLVFLRRVNSRILYAQMLGCATRRCDEIGKETFRIFDAVDLYANLQALS